MDREKLSIICKAAIMVSFSEIDALFAHPVVKNAYERFEKRGYLMKLKAIVTYEPAMSNQPVLLGDDLARIKIIQDAIGVFLLTELSRGDLKMAISQLLDSREWLANIDEEYESWRKKHQYLH